MKLYELERGKKFKLNEDPQQPPDIFLPANQDIIYRLHNIDGMYSYVTDIAGNVFHFAAWTEVTPIELPISDPSAL